MLWTPVYSHDVGSSCCQPELGDSKDCSKRVARNRPAWVVGHGMVLELAYCRLSFGSTLVLAWW